MSADRFKKAAKATSSGSWNKYSYTGDPVNRVDKRGLSSQCVADNCDESSTGDTDPDSCDEDGECLDDNGDYIDCNAYPNDPACYSYTKAQLTKCLQVASTAYEKQLAAVSQYVAANNPWNLNFSDVAAGALGSATTYFFLGGTIVGIGGGFAIGLGVNVVINFAKIYATPVGMENVLLAHMVKRSRIATSNGQQHQTNSPEPTPMKLQLLPCRPLRVLLVSFILGLFTTLRIIFIEHGQVGSAILLGVLQTIVAFGMFWLLLRRP